MVDEVFLDGTWFYLRRLVMQVRNNIWQSGAVKALFLLCLAIFPLKSLAVCQVLPGSGGKVFTTTGQNSFLFNVDSLAADGTPLTPWYITAFPQFIQCRADSSGMYYYSYYAGTPFNTYTKQDYKEAGYNWSLTYSYGSYGTGMGFAHGVSADGSKFFNVPANAYGDYTALNLSGSKYLNVGDVLTIPLYYQYRLFKTPSGTGTAVKPGSYTFTYGSATSYIAVDVTGGGVTNRLGNAVLIQPQTVTINNKTCSVLSSSLAVNLPAANVNNFPVLGSTSSPTPFTIPINCATSTNVYMTFTDLSNPAQTSSVLSASPSSTSSGLGLQLQRNGNQTIYFGPDSNLPGTVNQFLALGNAINVNSLSFTASYIRTGAVSPGTLNAAATFTMSYQ